MITAPPTRFARVRRCCLCNCPTRSTCGLLSEEPHGPAHAVLPLCIGCVELHGVDAYYIAHWRWSIWAGSLIERTWLVPGALTLHDIEVAVARGDCYRLISRGDSESYSRRLGAHLARRLLDAAGSRGGRW